MKYIIIISVAVASFIGGWILSPPPPLGNIIAQPAPVVTPIVADGEYTYDHELYDGAIVINVIYGDVDEASSKDIVSQVYPYEENQIYTNDNIDKSKVKTFIEPLFAEQREILEKRLNTVITPPTEIPTGATPSVANINALLE